MIKKEILSGFAIVVADRGWVYVGNVEVSEDFCTITNAKNIRYWGTSSGLGEIATLGPTEKTKTDDYGTVRVPVNAVISIIDADKTKWI